MSLTRTWYVTSPAVSSTWHCVHTCLVCLHSTSKSNPVFRYTLSKTVKCDIYLFCDIQLFFKYPCLNYKRVISRESLKCVKCMNFNSSKYIPVDMRRLLNVRFVLGHRRRRWTNTNPTLGNCLVFVWMWVIIQLLFLWSDGPAWNTQTPIQVFMQTIFLLFPIIFCRNVGQLASIQISHTHIF